MAEPIPAAKQEALAYLLAVTNDPAADEKRRDRAAVAVASLSYSLGAKGNAAALGDGGSNGHAVPYSKGLGDLVDLIVKLVEDFVALKRMVLDREKRIDALEAALATKTAYRDAWKAETTYRQNDEVTFKGQLWQCNYETTDKPGVSGAWRLKHKRERL